MSPAFDANCKRCGRLVAFLEGVRSQHPDYHCAPVAPFGDANAHLLIVGLAPGMHGANATGRPFTGDYAGILLYRTLYEFGFASQPESVSLDDGLRLRDCRITNAVKCLPPANKPTTAEIVACNDYLRTELDGLPEGAIVLALGAVAHNGVLRALRLKPRQFPFGHARVHAAGDERVLIDSYHCSRYNTQTRRLTDEMFRAVFRKVREHLPGRGR